MFILQINCYFVWSALLQVIAIMFFVRTAYPTNSVDSLTLQPLWMDTFQLFVFTLPGTVVLSVFAQIVGLAYLSIGISAFGGVSEPHVRWKITAFISHLGALILLLIRMNWFTIGIIPAQWKTKNVAMFMLTIVLVLTVLTVVSDAVVYQPKTTATNRFSLVAFFWLCVGFVLDSLCN
ncbi:hypothetical protein M3Y98_01154500 [Aphelenchoides besseyi]|nr:hypothetical protein M3Y98_01154500 [Aphelenchoides besseyi]KAI6210812.1 hypothetical protein M3Y96_00367800 [Aphelenchoides besseyi]